ncbi:MAG: acyltransferase family protein [Pseudomonadota bacterium]|jgi:fucose 4-O-acetylase-like acetyltransferase|uniref:acyltransferase family protein n=1 Tax=Sphingobium yanoikuyae TaxID=13690 RepID=UPI00137738F4|nr:acyltransferase family protein [Sphingobium yanoikuyae]NBB40033.1 acyltransferase family protein [Sphingobium yanoikuyae]
MENRGLAYQHAPQRLDWVDVARGIGIIAVVVGHVWTRGALRDAMYSFHMPLFFLLSGMLSRPHPAGLFARRQLLGQMRPYAIFLALLILADQIIEPAKGNLPIFHQWPRDLLPILLGGYWLRGPYTIFWFVPCLMLARILFNLALNRWPDPLDRRWLILMPGLLVLAEGLGWMTQASPLGLLSVPMAMILLWVGALWPRLHWRNLWIVPLGLLALAGLCGWLPTLNMKAADYGWPLFSIASGIATSLLLFRLSARLAPVAAPLAALGRASLVIMYLHVAIIHYGTPYLARPWLLVLALLAPFALWHLIRLSPRLSRWML